MALREGQVQVRDLVMGPGTVYRVGEDFNPFRLAARADQSGPRAWGHGSWSGVEWAEERVVPLRVFVRDDSDRTAAAAITATQRLTAAFRPVGDTLETVELRFAAGYREYVMFGRTRLAEADTSRLRHGSAWVNAAFVALDPFVYDGVESVAGPLSLPDFTGGLTVPFTVPFTVDTVQVGGGADLLNAGTADAGLRLRIDGPVNQPRLILVPATGAAQQLLVNADIAAGEFLDIDTAARTVLLGGATSYRGLTTGEFFALPPGGHRLEFRGDGSGTLTSRHRSAWW